MSLTPGLYCSDQGDYNYIKNQHRTINENLDQFLNGEMHLYKNGAFFLLSEGERCGALYPGTRALSDAALLLCAGWNDTAYYPSLSDMQSSLTIRNSSSSRFTLRVMAVVSLLLPVVAGYVAYAWRAVARPPRPHDAA